MFLHHHSSSNHTSCSTHCANTRPPFTQEAHTMPTCIQPVRQQHSLRQHAFALSKGSGQAAQTVPTCVEPACQQSTLCHHAVAMYPSSADHPTTQHQQIWHCTTGAAPAPSFIISITQPASYSTLLALIAGAAACLPQCATGAVFIHHPSN
jgi:hypothetical protein